MLSPLYTDGAVDLEEALGLGPRQNETETERMIRQGEMTPFGTILSGSAPDSAMPSGPRLSGKGQMTEFEKYLFDQTQKCRKKKPAKKSSATQNKSSVVKEKKNGIAEQTKQKETEDNQTKNKKLKMSRSKSAPSLSGMCHSDSDNASLGKNHNKVKRPNLFDTKDKRQYRPSEYDFSNYRNHQPRFARLKHNFSEDRRLSDFEDDDDDANKDQDYIPNEDMMLQEDEEFDIKESASPAKKRRQSKKQNWQSFSDDDGASSNEVRGEGRTKKKRSRKGHSSEGLPDGRIHDDGNYKCYRNRIR